MLAIIIENAKIMYENTTYARLPMKQTKLTEGSNTKPQILMDSRQRITKEEFCFNLCLGH